MRCVELVWLRSIHVDGGNKPANSSLAIISTYLSTYILHWDYLSHYCRGMLHKPRAHQPWPPPPPPTETLEAITTITIIPRDRELAMLHTYRCNDFSPADSPSTDLIRWCSFRCDGHLENGGIAG